MGAERSLHDALCVLSQTAGSDARVVYGGGYPEITMAKAVEELAARTPGKRALAMEGFARALRALPTTIADNAGLDSAELISQLRAKQGSADAATAGIDIMSGDVGDMVQCGIFEAF